MKITSLRLFMLCSCFLSTSNLFAQKNHASPSILDSLNEQLLAIAKSGVLPGFVVSVFDQDSIYFQKGYGYANIEKKTLYTPETVQIIASISKTLIGVALMKTVEEGLLNLDDPISEYLPFTVVNPKHPDDPITIRHLATHTSSIGDSKNSDNGYRFEKPLESGDFPEEYEPVLPQFNHTEEITMGEFLEHKLTANGQWYEPEVFTEERPGTTYEYSNLGSTLLAYIITLVNKESYADFTRKLILNPLKMTSSTWSLPEAVRKDHVTYYNQLYNVVPPYHIITYPDGGLYSNVADMTRFLQEMIRGYDGESEFLSKASFREMMSKQSKVVDLPDGICWDLSFPCCIGHAGNDFGTTTLMYFSPEGGIGRILFTNISAEMPEIEEAFFSIFNLLFQYQFK